MTALPKALTGLEHPLTEDQIAMVRDHLRGRGTAFLQITGDGQVRVVDPAEVLYPDDAGDAPR